MRSSTMAVAALAVLAALLLSSSVHAQSNFNIGSLFENVNVGSSGGGSSPKSAQDCRAGFASLGGISNLQNDGGILSCASGYGGSCCSAVRRYLGPGSAGRLRLPTRPAGRGARFGPRLREAHRRRGDQLLRNPDHEKRKVLCTGLRVRVRAIQNKD